MAMIHYVLLLSYKTGVFTSTAKLMAELSQGSKDDYKTAYDWKEIAQLIRDRYSVECLFLMGIEELSTLHKNVVYTVPLDCHGRFIESSIKKCLLNS